MAHPKRKTSKSRIRTRKSAHKHPINAVQKCQQCGAAQTPHRICPTCGYYRGRQVVTVQAD